MKWKKNYVAAGVEALQWGNFYIYLVEVII